MRPRPFRNGWLALVLVSGCVDLPQAQPGVADPVPEGMDAPCDDYILGQAPGGDDVCFAWVAIRCDAASDEATCGTAVNVSSPSGDLSCAWAPDAVSLDALDCAELDRTRRCVAAVARDDETCRGTRVWSRGDGDAQEVLVVELSCGLQPVPDFDACGQEPAAACC